MKSIAMTTAALLALATASAQDVQQISVGETTGFGIDYSLPLTTVQITVSAKCTTVKAGPYAPFAEKLLGIADAPQEDRTVWEIDGLQLAPGSVADTTRRFHIAFSGGVMPTFYLTPEGMLWSINQLPQMGEQEPKAEQPATAEKRKINVMTEELLRAGSKAKQAEVAARQIFRIRESRMDILTGEAENVPKDGVAYQLVMDNLDAQEQAYLAMFTGEKAETHTTRTYTYQPTGDVKEAVVFRFSHHFGLVEADDLSGAPYYLQVHVTEDNREAPQVETGKKKSVAPGIAYLLPGKAHISLVQGTTTLAERDMVLGQLGRVERLQATYFTDKKRAASAEFSPTTGAIRVFEQ